MKSQLKPGRVNVNSDDTHSDMFFINQFLEFKGP